MKALIDGDILRYEIGCATDDEGHPTPWPLVKSRLDGKIRSIVEAAGADTYTVYMSGVDNFRVVIATIRPYKGTRSEVKPHWHDKIEEYLKSGLNHPVTISDGYEADDGMSIEQCRRYWINVDKDGPFLPEDCWQDTVIASRDKDLNMVPGWHYSWGTSTCKEKEPWFVTEDEGYYNFFSQLLTGDTVDNIPGLYRIGATHAKAALKDCETPLDMYEKCRKMYKDRFGDYWGMFMEENAALLWMLREEPEHLCEQCCLAESFDMLEDFQVASEDREEEELDVKRVYIRRSKQT